MKATAAATIGATILAMIVGDIALAIIVAFATFGMGGFILGCADARDNETQHTLVAMLAAFAAGAVFAAANGATETMTLLVGAAAMGAALVAIILALLANDWARERARVRR